MNFSLLLGPVFFLDFEVPERISFGGGQRLAIQRLPGGGRVIDAMGRDDADLVWSGIFTGPDAADRARLLDALRVQGAVLPLTWDAFFYSVVIARFEAEYAHANWVPYKLTCTVLRDEAASAAAPGSDLAGSVLADLASASGAIDTGAATVAITAAEATSRGTAGYAAATVAVSALATQLNTTIATNETTLSAASLATAAGLTQAADAAGTLAAATRARGYVARATVNLANAGT
jgi:hypothetical protein